MGEQLTIGAAAGPRGHQPTSELRENFQRLSPGERVARTAELSSALTSVAAGRRK